MPSIADELPISSPIPVGFVLPGLDYDRAPVGAVPDIAAALIRREEPKWPEEETC